MALELFAHNEKAYRAAVRTMDAYGKAAIVHPTGTGKSYIAFKLIEDHPDAVVVWLSPSAYIFKTQIENLKKTDPDFPLENVHFFTYAKLMCLTVTNVRYLDNNRDMAAELFDDHIASEMTIGEVAVRGILPAPKYVTTVYQYQKALEKYQARVDNLRTVGLQDVNQKYPDALHRALEQADGLDKIFEHHITNKSGKYIVFCANKEQMDEMVSHAPERVSGINSDATVSEEKLGIWLANQKRAYQNGKLSTDQAKRLEKIGMCWGNRNDRQWNEVYQAAKLYFKAYGDLRVPVNYVSPDGNALGKWVRRQRYARLNPEKAAAS